jgi:hypothetical protein
VNRSLTAGLIALALLPGLAACGAGFEAQTLDVQADNAAGEVNGVIARAIVIVKGKNSPTGALAGTLINRGDKPDTLTTITLTDHSPGAQSVTISPNLILNPGQLVPLGVGEFKPITIPDARSIKVGNFTDVVLTFKEAGVLRLQVETKDRTFFYSDVIPEGAPTDQAKEKIKTTATPKATPAKPETPAAKQSPATDAE